MSFDRNKVVSVAIGEVGYLEKKSNAFLESKTANAGSANYTKYGKAMGCNGDYWCDAYVDWCFVKAYGKENARNILGGFSNYTPTSASYLPSINIKDALPGDLIFFKNSTRICHTAIIRKVENGRVYTTEGNTSGASGVVANGGGVANKYYSITYSKIAKVCRPNFDGSMVVSQPATTTDSKIDSVLEVQKWINDNYHYGIEEDGVYGKITKKCLVKILQSLIGTAVDGVYGTKTNSKVKTLKKGSKGTLVKVLQALLVCNGYKSAYVDGSYGGGTYSAVLAYQKKKFPNSKKEWDGVAGKKAFSALCK